MAATVDTYVNLDGMVQRLEYGDASPHGVGVEWNKAYVPINPPGAVTEGPGILKALVLAHPGISHAAAGAFPPLNEGPVGGNRGPPQSGIAWTRRSSLAGGNTAVIVAG